MALIKWYEVATSGDCLEDDTTWNDMITYIQHSACTDFTIYDTCPDTTQAFRFTTSGDFSILYGHEDAGKDMAIYANDSDTYPRIFLFGDSNIHIDSGDDIIFKTEGTEMARMSYAANVTTIEGGGVVGDDLLLKCNSTNTYPKIVLQGATDALYYTSNGFGHNFYEGGSIFLSLYYDGTNDVVEGKKDNNDLYLKPAGTGVVKFGTYNAKGAEAFDGFIPIKDAAGNNRKLMTCA